MNDKKTSNAPEPITPLPRYSLSCPPTDSGEVHKVHTSSPDWSNWTASMPVALDQATALTFNIDPCTLEQTSLWSVPVEIGARDAFIQRVEAIERQFRKSNIKLSDVATFAVHEAKWAGLPAELTAMASTVPAQGSCVTTEEHHPWEVIDPRDPKPDYPWYPAARYFARQLVAEDSTLLIKKQTLAEKVSLSMKDVGIMKRGGKKRFDAATVRKAFSNVTLD